MNSQLGRLSFAAFALGICMLISPAARAVDCVYSMVVACPPVMDPTSFVNGLEVVLNGGTGPESEECPPVAHINWDWGDGTLEPSYFPAYHEYLASGDYHIVVSATDDEDVELATASCNLSVEEVPDGLHSINLGRGAISPGYTSLALGYFASSEGYQATAIGHGASASGASSAALGFDTVSTNDASTALGAYAVADQPWTIVLGSIAGMNKAWDYTDVAIGTTAPNAPLHVYRNDGTALILVEEMNAIKGPRSLFEIANNGNPEFRMTNYGNSNSWTFSAGLRFVVKNNAGDWVSRIAANGDMEITGELTTGGTICGAGGCDLVFDPATEVESIEQHAEQMWNKRYLPAIGPTPEGKPFNLTEKTGGLINELEKAHIYIEQLHERLAALESRQVHVQQALIQLARQNEAAAMAQSVDLEN